MTDEEIKMHGESMLHKIFSARKDIKQRILIVLNEEERWLLVELLAKATEREQVIVGP
jgi:hypothetical protein